MVNKSAAGSGSIRLRKDGRWEARYTLGINPKTGKQIQKSIYGKTQKDVRINLSKIINNIDEGTHIEPSKLTVSKWMSIWLDTYCNRIKPSTKETYERSCRLYINESFGMIKIKDLNTLTIQTLYNDMLKQGLSPKTIKDTHSILNKALNQACKLGYIINNQATNCELPRYNKPKIAPFNDSEIKQLFSVIDSEHNKQIIKFALFTGMRLAEILALTWNNIDFKEKSITISKQLSLPRKKGSVYSLTSLKNGKPRKIYAADIVFKILKDILELQNIIDINKDNLSKFGNLVFCKVDGTNLTHGYMLKTIKRYLKKANLENKRFHDLRHTYAVNSLRAGDDPKTVSENLGHATVAFTLDVYTNLTNEMKIESAKRMNKFIINAGY